MSKNEEQKKPNVISAIPDPLSERDQALQLANWLKKIASDRLDHEMIRIANGHEDDDAVPGATFTYAEKRAQSDAAIKRLRDAFPVDMVARADELIAQQQ